MSDLGGIRSRKFNIQEWADSYRNYDNFSGGGRQPYDYRNQRPVGGGGGGTDVPKDPPADGGGAAPPPADDGGAAPPPPSADTGGGMFPEMTTQELPLDFGRGSSGSGSSGMSQMDALLKQIMGMGSGLPDLDPETKASLDQMLQSSVMDAEKQFEYQQEDLLEGLFGRGVQRSTIAGKAAGQMVEGQARTMAAIRADDAGRRIQLRQDQRNFELQRFQAAGQLMAEKLQAEVGFAGVDAQNYSTSMQGAIAQMNDATRRYLGVADLNLRKFELDQQRDLTLKGYENELEKQKLANEGMVAQAKAQKKKWWESLLGGVAGGLMSFIPGL